MENVLYANAYKEVLVVINNLVKEDYEKIPKEYIKFLEDNCNNDYEFEYDSSKSFDKQELLDETKYILFGLFEKFGATDTQKARIKSFVRNHNNKLEEEKRKKYNTDNLFKRDSQVNTEAKKEETNEMIVYKEQKWYKKIFTGILKIFKT